MAVYRWRRLFACDGCVKAFSVAGVAPCVMNNSWDMHMLNSSSALRRGGVLLFKISLVLLLRFEKFKNWVKATEKQENFACMKFSRISRISRTFPAREYLLFYSMSNLKKKTAQKQAKRSGDTAMGYSMLIPHVRPGHLHRWNFLEFSNVGFPHLQGCL